MIANPCVLANKLFSGVFALSMLIACGNIAVAEELNLPRQSLEKSLKSFARQYQVEIFFSSRDVAGKRANAVSGDLTIEQALQHLLRGSGMTYSIGPKGSVVIQKSAEVNKDKSLLQDNNGDEAESFTGIQEIIITARKREESLQQTPISISAFQTAELESRQINSLHQVAEATPNMIFDPVTGLSGSSASSSVFIRGVGQLDFTLNTDPGVGIYVDNVYLSRSIGSLVGLVDIERVEVLRGPQGTLYGRNTIGGAINITTRKPNENYGGRAKVSIGSFDRIDAVGGVNLPLTDTLFSRLSLSLRNRDGYMERFDGQRMSDMDSTAGRLGFRWLPANKITVDMTAETTKERQGSAPAALIDLDETATLPSLHNQYRSNSVDCYPPPGSIDNSSCYNRQWILGDEFDSNAGIDSRSDLDLSALSTTLFFDLGNVQLRSITAYRDFLSHSSLDLDHSPLKVFDLAVKQDIRVITQEFQVLGMALDYSFDWLFGIYYLREDGKHLELINASLFDIQSGGSVKNRSVATFAQGTYWFTDKLSLTVGMRYTDDTRKFIPDTFVLDSPLFGLESSAPPPNALLLPHRTFEISDKDVTPLINLAYQWSENSYLYFTYSEGFKSGGFTQRVSQPQQAPPDFGPEYVDLYELGFKYTGFDRRLRINTAVFHSEYSDIQVLGTLNTSIGASTVNAGVAEVEGVEVEMEFMPFNNLLIQLGVGYLDAYYTELDPDVVSIFIDTPLPKAAEWTVNGSIAYTFHMVKDYKITPRIDWSYRSAVANTSTDAPSADQDNYGLVNASVSVGTKDETWLLVLSGKNLTDERYTYDSGAIGAEFGVAEAIYAPPVTWELSLSYRWD